MRVLDTTAYAARRTNTIALLGDSQTAMYTYAQVFNGFSQKGIAAQSDFAWANALLGNRFQVVNAVDATRNNSAGIQAWDTFGGSGQTAQNLIDNGSVAAVIAANPAFCDLRIGTNDACSEGASAATIFGRIQTIVNAITAPGTIMILNTILPRGSGQVTGAQITTIQTVNASLRTWARSLRNVILCDMHEVWLDLAAANGQSLAAVTVDGVHASSYGAALLGVYKAAVLAQLVAPNFEQETLGLLSLAQHMQVGSGGSYTGTNPGGGSGAVASNFLCYVDAAGVLVGSKVARTDTVPGEWQQYAVTGTPGYDHRVSFSASYPAGQVYVGMAEVQFDSTSALPKHAGLTILDSNSGYAQSMIAPTYPTNFAVLPSVLKGKTLMLVTTPYTIPTGGSTVLRLSARSEGGDHTIRWGREQLVRVA